MGDFLFPDSFTSEKKQEKYNTYVKQYFHLVQSNKGETHMHLVKKKIRYKRGSLTATDQGLGMGHVANN